MMVPETHLLYKEFNGVKRLAISYSQIDTFLTCPMKWYKTYVEGKRSTEKQEATSYGTVIHKTLEYFFKTGKYDDSHEAIWRTSCLDCGSV